MKTPLWTKYVLLALFGILIGGASYAAYDKYVRVEDHHDVHYHANFQVYLNGHVVDFNSDKYMEELWTCSKDPNTQHPKDRVHMHQNKGWLVHVHAAGATWGHLFANLGWNFGSAYLVDDSGNMYQPKDGKRLRYVLNGLIVPNPFNTEIKSEDRLLVDYSADSDETVMKRFTEVPTDAKQQNLVPDPPSCGGSTQ